MPYPTFYGGMTSFAIGPAPNEFRADTEAGAIVQLDAQTAAFPAWLAFYDAAPIGGDSAALNVRIFYLDGGTQVLKLMARDNGNWTINEQFEGVVGQQGSDGINGTGVTSSFSSLAILNAYYVTDDNFQNLKTGDNASVTEDEVVYTYRWGGIDNPTVYDPNSWGKSEIGTTAGSLRMGPTSLESSSECLMFKSSSGGSHYILQSFFDSTGSSMPQYFDVGPEYTFTLAPVLDTDLPLPINFETVFPDTNVFTAYTIKPALKGNLSFKTYIGTQASHQSEPILSESVYIDVLDVGTTKTISMANPAVINQGQSLYTEVTGDAHLFGGVQTGVMVGQTTMWCDLTMQNVTKENLALTKDFSDPAINNGTVKITPSDTALKTLESKLVAGSNIVLDTQDIGGGEEVIVIGSTGGDPVVAMLGGKAVGFQDDTGELYATPQFTVDLATTTTGKPFYYKGNEAAPTTDIIGTSVTDFDFNLFSYTWTQGETKTYEAMTMWATIACEINIRIRPMEDLSTTIIRSEIIRVEAGDVGAPQFLPCYKSFELVAGKIYKMDITKNTTINNVPAKGENLGPSYVPYFGLIYYAPASFAPETLAVEASLYPFVQYVSLPLAVMTATSQPMITAQTLVTGKYKIEYGLSLTTSLNTERRFVGIRVEIDGVKKGGGLGGIESTSGNGNFFDDVSGVVYVDVTEASVSLDVKITASSITNTKIQDVYAYVTKLT